MPPTGVWPYLKVDREVIACKGSTLFDPIIAGIDPDPCAFRPYCRWLIGRLGVLTPVQILNWPEDDADEDFVEIEIQVLLTSVIVHLDRWIGIASATIPATPVGEKILGLIEQANRGDEHPHCQAAHS